LITHFFVLLVSCCSGRGTLVLLMNVFCQRSDLRKKIEIQSEPRFRGYSTNSYTLNIHVHRRRSATNCSESTCYISLKYSTIRSISDTEHQHEAKALLWFLHGHEIESRQCKK